MRTLEQQSKSIVLVGKFNPSIMQPAWLAMQGLISQTEAENAKITLIHPDFLDFDLDWISIQMTKDRTVFATTQDAYFEALRDLVLSVFNILYHTPMTKLGINIDVHYRFDTIEEWNEYGHTLAPKQIWEKCLTKPGLKSLTITQSEREDGNIGFIQVKTEASTITNPGILISVNDHFEIGSEEPNSSKIISQLLEENWDKSTERAQFIIENLINFDKD